MSLAVNLEPERATKKFVAKYYHDGEWWTLVVLAYDWDDADARCKKLGLKLMGQVCFTTRSGIVAQASVAIGNALDWAKGIFRR